MLRRLSRRLSYANVMSTIAVFVALGTGGAYAANTIRGSDIVDNEVSSADVRDDTLGFGGLGHQDLGPDSVRASEVKDNEINSNDIRDDTLGFGGLQSQDLGKGSVGSSEVADGSLNDKDVSKTSVKNFGVDFGAVSGNTGIGPHDCFVAYPPILKGVQSDGDHVILTQVDFLNQKLTYAARDDGAGGVGIQVCNPTAAPQVIGPLSEFGDFYHPRFSLLVIDAQ